MQIDGGWLRSALAMSAWGGATDGHTRLLSLGAWRMASKRDV